MAVGHSGRLAAAGPAGNGGRAGGASATSPAGAARAAGLSITGYNLFVWYQYSQDLATIQTIEHQTGINLLPLLLA